MASEDPKRGALLAVSAAALAAVFLLAYQAANRAAPRERSSQPVRHPVRREAPEPALPHRLAGADRRGRARVELSKGLVAGAHGT